MENRAYSKKSNVQVYRNEKFIFYNVGLGTLSIKVAVEIHR